MKKIVFAFFLFVVVAAQAADSPIISEKILKAFNETFIDVKNVRWTEVDNIYFAYFLQGDVQVRASYDEKGNLLTTIRYYYEKQLVPAILSKLKKEYAGTTIFLVREISSEEGIIYFITLRNENYWYTVKSDTFGNLEQTEKFERGDK
jgi:hypothetical protein